MEGGGGRTKGEGGMGMYLFAADAPITLKTELALASERCEFLSSFRWLPSLLSSIL